MRKKLVGKVISTNIGEMSGRQFGTITVESDSGSRYELKYDKKSKGLIPRVGEITTLFFEPGSINRITEITLGTPETLVQKAKEFESKSKFEQAISAYEDALALDESYCSAWNLKAKLHFKLNQIDAVRECYTHLLELEPISSRTYEIKRLLEGDISVLEKKKVIDFEPLDNSRRGFTLKTQSGELEEALRSWMAKIAKDACGNIYDYQDYIVLTNETLDKPILDMSDSRIPTIPKSGKFGDLVTWGLESIYQKIAKEENKQKALNGSVWIEQRFRRKSTHLPSDTDLIFSVLYQGTLIGSSLVIFPNIWISTALDFSIPQGISFLSFGQTTSKREVYYFVIPTTEQIRQKRGKGEFEKLSNPADANILKIFTDESLAGNEDIDPAKRYDEAIQALKLAKATDSKIMDTFRKLHSNSSFLSQHEDYISTSKIQGFPVLSIIPWHQKTIISIQFNPNPFSKEMSKSVVQKIHSGEVETHYEIALPNQYLIATAFECVEHFLEIKDSLPRTNAPSTNSSYLVLMGQVLEALDISKDILYPSTPRITVDEILTLSHRVNHIIHLLEQKESINLRIMPYHGYVE